MTLLILILTTLVSIGALSNTVLFDKLKFNAYYIKHSGEWYRFFSYAIIHSDWLHLFVNMFVLFFFGRIVEQEYAYYFEERAKLFYVLLYLGGVCFSVLHSYQRFRDDITYNAVGASGAVSAVVFASILLHPESKIMFVFLPIGIPAPIFGILYLIYSAAMDRRGVGKIGHNAHFWGAIVGFTFTLALKPELLIRMVDTLF